MVKNSNGTLTYRVGQLEKNYDKLDTKMDAILTNHLPHIEQRIIAFNTKLNVYTALNITAIIVGIILSRLFL